MSATLLNQPFFSAQEITLKLEYVILRLDYLTGKQGGSNVWTFISN